MIKKLLNKIWSVEGQEEISTPLDQEAEFVLMYQELPIGYLSLKDGLWKFEYSVQFKRQSELLPLVDFPDKSKTYTNTNLWPYFSYRIPGLNQPQVQDMIKKANINEKNIVDLLKLFGKHSIYNPFLLDVMTPNH